MVESDSRFHRSQPQTPCSPTYQSRQISWIGAVGEAILSFLFMDPTSPSRLDCQEAGEYQSAEEAMEVLSDSEFDGYELELESLTEKGINRLCSELLKLKIASDEDFQKKYFFKLFSLPEGWIMYRIFEEFGAIESEVMKMKNHVSTQNMLVEEFMNSFHSEAILEKLENMEDESVQDLDLDFPSWMETRMQNIFGNTGYSYIRTPNGRSFSCLGEEDRHLAEVTKRKGQFLSDYQSICLCNFRLED